MTKQEFEAVEKVIDETFNKRLDEIEHILDEMYSFRDKIRSSILRRYFECDIQSYHFIKNMFITLRFELKENINKERPKAKPEVIDPNPCLDSCPFCGCGTVRIEKVLRGGYNHNDCEAYAYAVVCPSCAAEGGWGKSGSSAVSMWNMRSLT